LYYAGFFVVVLAMNPPPMQAASYQPSASPMYPLKPQSVPAVPNNYTDGTNSAAYPAPAPMGQFFMQRSRCFSADNNRFPRCPQTEGWRGILNHSTSTAFILKM